MPKVSPDDLQYVLLKLSDVKPSENNPRTHSQKQKNMLLAGVSRVGFVSAILVTPEHRIIAGHLRFDVAKEIGLEVIPAIIVPGLSEAEERALRISDNKISEAGGWSVDLLKADFEFLVKSEFEIEPLMLGFETPEFDALDTTSSKRKVEAAPDPNRLVPAASRIGDRWSINGHVIVCGNSLDEATYRLLLGDERADVVISDLR